MRRRRRKAAAFASIFLLSSVLLSGCPAPNPHPWEDCRRYPVYC